jgi:carboxylate-amine ligase
LTRGVPEVRFGAEADFALGVEEELLLVDPATLELVHDAERVLAAVSSSPQAGAIGPDTYAALVELASPVVRGAAEGAERLVALRAAVRAAGGTLLGAGIHPSGAFGDVVHYPAERYEEIHRQLRGLLRRTPTSALHVHVGAPDAETAVRISNGMREHLPLLQALAANSPFWHGSDSGLDSARAQLFRGLARADIPPAWPSFDAYLEYVDAVVRAGDLDDYTFLWADLRLHPGLGTVEMRAMDAQSAPWSVAGLAALVHGLAIEAASAPLDAPPTPREVLMESSFRAARDGTAATLWSGGALRPVAEIARAAAARARAHLPGAGDDAALDGVERILAEGNGAARQRAAFSRGGLRGVLELLVAETQS